MKTFGEIDQESFALGFNYALGCASENLLSHIKHISDYEDNDLAMFCIKSLNESFYRASTSMIRAAEGDPEKIIDTFNEIQNLYGSYDHAGE